jgi:hypothetical protein
MTDYIENDRRTRDNAPLTALVNLAITFRRTLGERMARNYLATSAIPGHIAERILRNPAQRRMTDWECVQRETAEQRERHAATHSVKDNAKS